MLVLLLLAAATPPDLVDEPGGPRIHLLPDERAAPKHAWYGYQTLIVRGAAVGLAGLGGLVSRESEELGFFLAGIGGVAFTFGPAVVHGMNGEAGHALASFLLNFFIPPACAGIGLAVGFAEGRDGRWLSGIGEGVVGIAVGLGVASLALMVVDATVLGYADTKPVPLVLLSPKGTPMAGLALAL